MKKFMEEIITILNKVLPFLTVLFFIFAIYIRISIGFSTKRVEQKASGETIADIEDGSMADNSTQYSEEQEYEMMKGFTVYAKSEGKKENTDTENVNSKDENADIADSDISDVFAFPDSYREELTVSDVSSLKTAEEVQDAINYIYARSGCIFQDEEKQAYYEAFDWYEGSYPVEEMNQAPLDYMTEIQYQNIQLLAKRRSELNG